MSFREMGDLIQDAKTAMAKGKIDDAFKVITRVKDMIRSVELEYELYLHDLRINIDQALSAFGYVDTMDPADIEYVNLCLDDAAEEIQEGAIDR